MPSSVLTPDSDLSLSGGVHGELADAPIFVHALDDPQREGSYCKKPWVSKTKPGQHLSKTPSIPLLRRLVMSDAEAADKKRNKLGYQRISIACAHCRRRKIRCVVKEPEEEPRCDNCIRLKKECIFYPVDQQAVIDARSEASSSRAGGRSAPSSTVSSSPPATGRHVGGHYQNTAPESVGGFSGVPIASTSAISPQDGIPRQEYGYLPQGQSPMPWQHQQDFVHHHPHHQAPTFVGPNVHPALRYGSVAADAAPFPVSMDQHPQTVRQGEAHGYAPTQLQQPWQQPVRSMSFSEYSNHNMYSPTFPLDQQHGSFARQQPYPRAPQHGAMAPSPDAAHHQYPQYLAAHGQRGVSTPIMTTYHPQQQMHPTWHPGPFSYGHMGEEESRDDEYAG